MDILKQMAADRDERVQDLFLDLPIPTWDGGLVARFEVQDRKLVEKMAKSKKKAESDQDFVIKSTRELYVLDPTRSVTDAHRMDENEDYVRIESDGAPVLWTADLIARMGGPEGITDPRDVVRYCVKGNDIAVAGLSGRLINWMQDTDSEVAGSLQGES